MLSMETTLSRLPLFVRLTLIFLVSGLLWAGIIAVAMAAECSNANVTDQLLPPAQYRHEPTMPYTVMPAGMLAGLRGSSESHVLGYYFVRADVIAVCKGLTGRALRIVRMHEEAHRAGWRHG